MFINNLNKYSKKKIYEYIIFTTKIHDIFIMTKTLIYFLIITKHLLKIKLKVLNYK